ncbi:MULTISPECIES: DUF1496 domain-containing protein [Pseudoalteromonas]|uniref:DUF1496 domain-containing protein n=1 Tax=Pseudoalteromonas piscicida TaxID=43662 RepID=A0AAQ2ESV4_PSEO7|nr:MULTISPECIES: DUF1496 domain-containing protein [Pseudoalteromonas]MCO7197922.1 YnjH family protein [Pseudoalteromonas sp. OANN1]TMN40688.1 DUF1496 domain-containing protein [Pseudoalteromonas piscicida]TMN43765.1 DUF1496 domain-containing protein [Pseudoalteromonas piscicida]TMN50817.1 DUF1496 domain-containing protein [Pseudoalteromonas piscicida]TMN57103.1 DUF1496 domain-containing protein [Pseudoalteromonas piscicida]
MKFLICLIAVNLISLPILATTPTDLRLYGEIPKQVCWYEGKSYSEGALLLQFDMLFVCATKKYNEDNGKLVWVKADASGAPIRPEISDKIRVN